MSSAGSAVTLGQSDHPLRREQMWVAARTDWDLRYELRLTRYLEPGGCCSVSRHLDVVGDVQEKRGFYATEMHAHLAQALERPKEIWWGWEDRSNIFLFLKMPVFPTKRPCAFVEKGQNLLPCSHYQSSRASESTWVRFYSRNLISFLYYKKALESTLNFAFNQFVMLLWFCHIDLWIWCNLKNSFLILQYFNLLKRAHFN